MPTGPISCMRAARLRVVEAVAPCEHAGGEQRREAQHGGGDRGDAERVAQHPQHHRAQHRRAHDSLVPARMQVRVPRMDIMPAMRTI